MKQEFVPKGSMCMVCMNRFKDCSKLPFELFKPITKHKDGVIEVKCEAFCKERQDETTN